MEAGGLALLEVGPAILVAHSDTEVSEDASVSSASDLEVDDGISDDTQNIATKWSFAWEPTSPKNLLRDEVNRLREENTRLTKELRDCRKILDGVRYRKRRLRDIWKPTARR